MKPTFILIKQEASLIAINSQDLKTITLKDGKATINTSTSSVEVPCTDYMADRIKQELRSRYNFVNITGNSSRTQDNRKDNAILCLQDGNSTVLVFPKALKYLRVNDAKLVACVVHPKSMAKTFSVPLTVPVDLSRINLGGMFGAAAAQHSQVSLS